jgi:predicted ester cyclase
MADHHTGRLLQFTEDYTTIWDEADYENISNVIAEEYTLYSPVTPAEGVTGREGLEAHLRELRVEFPDFQVENLDQLVGDDVVMDEWRVTATHDGEFDDIPPTERAVELQGMDEILISDGTVAHRIPWRPRGGDRRTGSVADRSPSSRTRTGGGRGAGRTTG